MAYAPFGEGYAGGQAYVQFTSYGNQWTVSDGENSGGSLDDFTYRRYSPGQGRWISPDPAGLGAVDPSNPQSWNRYAYVLNNPLGGTDPLGTECVWDDGSFDSADDPDTGSADGCAGQGGTWVDPGLFENAMLTTGQSHSSYGDWSSSPNATLAQNWATPSATASAQPGTLLQYLFSTVPTNVANDVPLSPSAQAAALAIHNSLTYLPSVCSVGINGSVGGNRVSVGADLNSGKGLNPIGQISTPVAPFVSARYNIGTNGEIPTVSAASLRFGAPTGFAATVGVTSSGTVTSLGGNFQLTFPRIGKVSATAYVGVGNAYSCP
jgi:RHS repeat-associated protein